MRFRVDYCLRGAKLDGRPDCTQPVSTHHRLAGALHGAEAQPEADNFLQAVRILTDDYSLIKELIQAGEGNNQTAVKTTLQSRTDGMLLLPSDEVLEEFVRTEFKLNNDEFLKASLFQSVTRDILLVRPATMWIPMPHYSPLSCAPS